MFDKILGMFIMIFILRLFIDAIAKPFIKRYGIINMILIGLGAVSFIFMNVLIIGLAPMPR